MRTAYDFSPLYRSVIGVDRMADLIETAMRSDGERNYPPYDIEKVGDDAYRITLATAGFKPEELELIAQPNLLIIAGRKIDGGDKDNRYLHRGIAARNFERRFELARMSHTVIGLGPADYHLDGFGSLSGDRHG